MADVDQAKNVEESTPTVEEDALIVAEEEASQERPISAQSLTEEISSKPISSAHLHLSVETIAKGISLMSRTGNGNSHAYTKLELVNFDIGNIDVLESYTHLRYLNLSLNAITNIEPLASLEYLLSLDLSQNDLNNIPSCLEKRKYLQQANFAKNKISEILISGWHLLTWFNLNENQMSELNLHDFPSLIHLELRKNLLTSTSGIQIPSLRRLYLAQNEIEKVSDLDNLVHIQLLHLRDNKISNLDGFSEAPKDLTYLNLRNNKIFSFSEIDKLECLPSLKTLVLLQNPIDSTTGYRLEVIMRLPKLEKLDKDVVTDEEREEAQTYKIEKIQKQKEEEIELAKDALENAMEMEHNNQEKEEVEEE